MSCFGKKKLEEHSTGAVKLVCNSFSSVIDTGAKMEKERGIKDKQKNKQKFNSKSFI